MPSFSFLTLGCEIMLYGIAVLFFKSGYRQICHRHKWDKHIVGMEPPGIDIYLCFYPSCPKVFNLSQRFTAALLPELKKARTQYNMNKLSMGPTFTDSDPVICKPNGTPYQPDSMSQKWDRFIKNQPIKKIRFHDLHHPYAKHTTKNIFLQKQKSQTINFDFDSLGFLFLCAYKFGRKIPAGAWNFQ